MAFLIGNLQPIGGQSRIGSAPQMWSYSTTDATAVVDTAGYFNGARTVLAPGDLIHRVTLTALTGGTVVSAGLHTVLAVPATGNVDVSDATALSVTNTD